MVRWDVDWLDNRAKLTPDRVALVEAEGNHSLTYNELLSRSINLAHWLKGEGIQKGDRVALLAPNSLIYFELLFACCKLGAIFVPINWRLTPTEIEYILEDCLPEVVFFHGKYADSIKKLNTDLLKRAIQLDRFTFDLEMGEPTFIEDVQVIDPLAIIYTGGTTGKPKGVVLTHESILWNGINTVVSWGLTSDDITLNYLPLFHTGGLNALSIPILMAGGKVVIASDFDPVDAISFLNEYCCTIALFVPTMYHLMVRTPEFQASDFPSMKTFLSGGAPCPLELYEPFQKKDLFFKEGYGLTEAGPNNFYIHPLEARRKIGSVGKPMLFNKVKLVNLDGKEVAEGEVGEIVIVGKHSFSHYWNNAAATHETIRENWIYTGDLGKVDADGYYYIVGRKKDMIITGGENVYPLEIEQWISALSGVAEVAVVGLPDPKWGEVVSAFIVVGKETKLNKEDIYTYCKERLGSYKIPKYIFFVSELPKTHVGKIDKEQLKLIGKRIKA